MNVFYKNNKKNKKTNRWRILSLNRNIYMWLQIVAWVDACIVFIMSVLSWLIPTRESFLFIENSREKNFVSPWLWVLLLFYVLFAWMWFALGRYIAKKKLWTLQQKDFWLILYILILGMVPFLWGWNILWNIIVGMKYQCSVGKVFVYNMIGIIGKILYLVILFLIFQESFYEEQIRAEIFIIILPIFGFILSYVVGKRMQKI